jgi:hypothetical protein
MAPLKVSMPEFESAITGPARAISSVLMQTDKKDFIVRPPEYVSPVIGSHSQRLSAE